MTTSWNVSIRWEPQSMKYCTGGTKLSCNTLEKCLLFYHEKNTLSFKRFKVVKNCPNIKDHLKFFLSKFGIERLRSLIRFQDPDRDPQLSGNTVSEFGSLPLFTYRIRNRNHVHSLVEIFSKQYTSYPSSLIFIFAKSNFL